MREKCNFTRNSQLASARHTGPGISLRIVQYDLVVQLDCDPGKVPLKSVLETVDLQICNHKS